MSSTHIDYLRLTDYNADPETPSADERMLASVNDVVVYWNGTAWVSVSGTGTGDDTLDSAYDNGRTITVDVGSVVLNGVDEDTAVMTINGDGDTAGTLLQLTHTTATRKDINGTGDTWWVTGEGASKFTAIDMQDNELITFGTDDDATIGWTGAVLNIAGAVDFDNSLTLAASATITQAGAAGSTVFTITAGDVVWSDASLAITDADNAETVTVINNTATTIGAAASAGVIQVESTSLTTGAAINVQLTEGTLNGGFYYSAWDATAGARVFSVGENGVITLTGAGAADALTITSGDVVVSDGSLSLTDADNAESVTIINNTATTIGASATAGVVQIESTSLTTGAALNVQLTEGTLNGGFYYSAWDATAGARVWSVGEDGATVIAGAGGSTVFTVTAGDLVISDGSIALTDADNAATLTVTNNTATTIGAAASAGVASLVSTSLTTGALLNLELTEGTLNGGWYLRAWDATAAAAVFSVGEDGATVIAGAAIGTAALTLTAGDEVLTSGNLILTSGHIKNTPQAIVDANTAISIVTLGTTIANNGASTHTLADGTVGQLKYIVCTVYTGDAVITPANFVGTTITLNAAGDSWLGVFVGTEWVTLSLGGTAAVA